MFICEKWINHDKLMYVHKYLKPMQSNSTQVKTFTVSYIHKVH